MALLRIIGFIVAIAQPAYSSEVRLLQLFLNFVHGLHAGLLVDQHLPFDFGQV